MIENSTEVAEIILALNEALNEMGGLPISVSLISEQNAGQFWVMAGIGILGVLFIVPLLVRSVMPVIGDLICFTRLALLKNHTGRHVLLLKHTQVDLFSQSMIQTKTLYSVERALRKFCGRPFDLVIHTPGGEIFATQLLSKVFREYPGEIRAMVPLYAMSGGTVLALSCDKIYLGDTACLGPIDPQIGSILSSGSARSWQEVVRKKGRKADDFSIQMAFLGNQYARTIQNMLDMLLRDKVPNPAIRAQAVRRLASGEVEHALPLSALDLTGLGIPIQRLAGPAKKVMLDIILAKNIEGVYAI